MQQNIGCRWVLTDGSPCGVKTRYKMVEDGGEPGAPKVREYSPWCDEHERQAKANIARENDEPVDDNEAVITDLLDKKTASFLELDRKRQVEVVDELDALMGTAIGRDMDVYKARDFLRAMELACAAADISVYAHLRHK